MKRRARLRRLALWVLALFTAAAMPRAGWLVHHHAGDEHAHVHLDDAPEHRHGGDHDPAPAHGHLDGRHHDAAPAHGEDDAPTHTHAHHLVHAHHGAHDHHRAHAGAHAHADAGDPGRDRPGLDPPDPSHRDHVHWLQPFQLAAALAVPRPFRAEIVRAVAADPPARPAHVAAVPAPARGPPLSSPSSER